MSLNQLKLSLKSKTSSSSSTNINPICNNDYLIFEDYCIHIKTYGKLTLDIKKEKFTFSAKGKMSDDFINTYKNRTEFEVLLSNIKIFQYINEIDTGKYKLSMEMKNKTHKVFIFEKETKKNYEETWDKFVYLINSSIIKNKEVGKNEKFIPFFEFYSTELSKMDEVTKKKICFLMKNKDLLILYLRLSKIYDPETIFQYIRNIRPEKIDINLGENRIQLSRDEELLIQFHFYNKIFNMNKLILSDIDMLNEKKLYYKDKIKDGFQPEEFWNNFYSDQKENKTYIIGKYKPIYSHDENNFEINDNNLFEELEKNKYYYDNYETNYLLKENENDENDIKTLLNNYSINKMKENENDIKTLLNNYSINKMKEINYFSYTPQNLNIYKSINISKSPKMNLLSQDMEVEYYYENKDKNRKRIPKSELYKRISKMRKEYKQNTIIDKNNKNNTTIKAINEEVNKIYYLSNTLDKSGQSFMDLYEKINLIRELSIICDRENNLYQKNKDIISKQKRKEKKAKIKYIQNEMEEILEEIEIIDNNYHQKTLFNFLIKYAEYITLN